MPLHKTGEARKDGEKRENKGVALLFQDYGRHGTFSLK